MEGANEGQGFMPLKCPVNAEGSKGVLFPPGST